MLITVYGYMRKNQLKKKNTGQQTDANLSQCYLMIGSQKSNGMMTNREN